MVQPSRDLAVDTRIGDNGADTAEWVDLGDKLGLVCRGECATIPTGSCPGVNGCERTRGLATPPADVSTIGESVSAGVEAAPSPVTASKFVDSSGPCCGEDETSEAASAATKETSCSTRCRTALGHGTVA